jgi:type I restriction enzyme M protein
MFGRNIWGCPTDSSADFAWLQHMVKSMNRRYCRCAVVLPQGVLFHSGKEGDMREKLVRSDKLEALLLWLVVCFTVPAYRLVFFPE